MSKLFTGAAGLATWFSDGGAGRNGGRNPKTLPREFGEMRPALLQAA